VRRLVGASFVALVMVVSAVGSAAAYGGPQLAASACGGGKLVINVTQKVVNDADSGFGGAWAFDSYNRQIQVWQTAPGMFCGIVNYAGQFVTLAGTSPSGIGAVTGGVKGTMHGGYRTTQFIGALNVAPTWLTQGSIGTFDYDCDLSFNCPGAVSWVGTYFSSTSGFDLAWWGWEYRAGSHGTWVNDIGGSSGDITG